MTQAVTQVVTQAVKQVCERFNNLGADGAPVRLGLMGGTFDPIHNGHLRIAEEVREALALDAVLFIPTGEPVFKRDQKVSDAHTRLECVRRAVRSNPHFDVSAIEVERAGATYTIDTLRELREHYPKNVEFYFIIGSDAAADIGKWRNVAEIAALTHVAVAIGRPGFAQTEELREKILTAASFDLHFVQVTALEISSSDIRERLATGKSVRYLAPDEAQVEASWASNAWQFHFGDESALSKEFYKARKAELARRVNEKRFKHIMGVAKTAKALAKRYGVNPRKARLAGLLHDWDKGLNDEQARERVRELGLDEVLDPWVVEHMPRVLHSHTAAVALARDFPEISGDVLQAIDRHTTAAEDMSSLDKILYIADALEPNRQFGRIDELRELAKAATLDELYFQTYEYWTLLLFERRAPLHPDTMRIWNANALRWQAEKQAKKQAKKQAEKQVEKERRK